MEHRVLKAFPSTVPLFSLFLTKVSFPFSHHMFFDEGPWTPEETWQDQECCMTLDQECCILSWVHNVANPTVKGREGTPFGTILSLAVPLYICENLRQLLPCARSTGLPAPREPQPHLVSLNVCSGTYKSGGFPFPGLICPSLCLGHTSFLGSWDSPHHLLIQEVDRERRNPPKKMLWKNSCLEGNPWISKYRKHQNKRARIVNI